METAPETAWMVERPHFPALYLTVVSGSFDWTEDVETGLRFARQMDALRMTTVFAFEEAVANEHQWG